MPASYNVVPVLQTPTVNPGDTVKIEIYIIGAGDINKNRLHILHPYPNLFQENVGTLKPSMIFVPEDEVNENIGSTYVARPIEDVSEEHGVVHNLDTVAEAIDPPDRMFQPMPESLLRDTRNSLGAGGGSPPTFPLKPIEIKFNGAAPYEMELNISEDAQPGDYELDFIFLYETEIISSSRRSVQIHVNDWIEKRQPNLKRIIIAVALLGLLLQSIGPLLSLISSLTV